LVNFYNESQALKGSVRAVQSFLMRADFERRVFHGPRKHFGQEVLFCLASIVLCPRRFQGVEPERRLGGRRDLGLFLFRLLGFAVSALLTFCHRNPPMNPGVTCDGHVIQFCKQPLEVGENIRDEPDPSRIFGSWRLRKTESEDNGPWPPLHPSRWQTRREESAPVPPGAPAARHGRTRPWRADAASRSPSARPSLVDHPDRLCPPPKFAHFEPAVSRPGESKTQRTQPCIHQYTLPRVGAREFSRGPSRAGRSGA
jgi:hypothetical protein